MKRILMTVVAAALLAATLNADGPPTKSPAKPQGKPKTKPDSQRICGINWETKLDVALKKAMGEKGTNDRPVMVLRVLGDLDGFM